MTITRTRITKVEQRFADAGDDCGPLTIIAPNSWSDADRATWEQGELVPDAERDGDLIEKYHGQRPRPCSRGHFVIIEVPAPQDLEDADEATRAAWRQSRGMRR